MATRKNAKTLDENLCWFSKVSNENDSNEDESTENSSEDESTENSSEVVEKQVDSQDISALKQESNFCKPCLRDEVRVLANVYCCECSEILCRDCKKHHSKNKFTSSHTVMSIKGDLSETKRLDYVNKLTKCHNHPTEEVKYLCKDHDQLCCNECAIVTHRKCQSLLSITNCIATGFPKCVREDMEKIEKHAEGLKIHELNNKQRLDDSERIVKDQLIFLKLQFDNAFQNFEEKVMKTVKTKCNGLRSSVHTQQIRIEKFEAALKQSKEKITSTEQFGQDLHFYLMEREMKNEMAQHEQVLKSLHQEANCTEISLAGINFINGQLIKCLEKNLTVNETESKSALPQLPDFKLQGKPFPFGNRRSPHRPNSNNGYGGRMGYWQ